MARAVRGPRGRWEGGQAPKSRIIHREIERSGEQIKLEDLPYRPGNRRRDGCWVVFNRI
jgi:hypothetical protein